MTSLIPLLSFVIKIVYDVVYVTETFAASCFCNWNCPNSGSMTWLMCVLPKTHPQIVFMYSASSCVDGNNVGAVLMHAFSKVRMGGGNQSQAQPAIHLLMMAASQRSGSMQLTMKYFTAVNSCGRLSFSTYACRLAPSAPFSFHPWNRTCYVSESWNSDVFHLHI